jgi:predicted transcriptional regulator
METLKQEAISAIAKLPDSADIDEIMYRLYVIDKVRKGEDSIQRGEYTTTEDLKKEIESW